MKDKTESSQETVVVRPILCTDSAPLQVGRVRYADNANIQAFEPLVQEILDVLGYSDAWVSDESLFGDFFLKNSGKWKRAQERLRELLGVEVERSDYIVAVAARLYLLRKDI